MKDNDEFSFTKPKPLTDDEFSASGLGLAVNAVVDALVTGEIPPIHVGRIRSAMPPGENGDGYDENFDLLSELSAQLALVRGMRKTVFNLDGSLRDGYGVDDANRIMSASRDLMKLLQTSHEDLVNYGRIQAIENAFLDTIAAMDQPSQERYAELLATYLEQHSPG